MKKILLVVALMLVASTAFASRCMVELQTDRGRTLDSFRARGYDIREACGQARRECRRELNHRHRMGRNPYAKCVVVRRDNNGGYNPHPRPQPRPERRSITCSSQDMRFDRCYLDRGASNVRLQRQISNSPCIQGRSFGFDRDSIWVDNGCRAIFTYEVGGRRY